MVLMGKDINQQGPLALTMGHLSKMSEMGKVSRNLRVGVIEVRYPVSVFPLLSSPDSQGGPTSKLGFKLCGRTSYGGVGSPLDD